jgi:hypothetical protein
MVDPVPVPYLLDAVMQASQRAADGAVILGAHVVVEL